MDPVTIGSLWLAILLAAVLTFIASAVIWTVMPHHKKDYAPFPDEPAVRAAMKGIAPGQYIVPYAAEQSELKDPAVRKKFDEGPFGFFTALPSGVPNMGKSMALSFVFYLVVSVVIAYLASRTMAAGTEYLQVFRVTGTVAWLAYGFGVVPDAIWFGRPWSAVGKHLADALVYALLTAGVFGWLWPA